MNGKAPLMTLLSALIDVPNVAIQSRIKDELVSFSGTIVGIRFGKDTDPFILIEGDDGQRYFVGPDDLQIHLNRSDRVKTQAEPRASAVGHCLAVHDGRVCRKAKGHTSPHDWEVYPLGSSSLR
jgi:hypothetical protein